MHTPPPYKEERPWGSFERFANNEQVTVKLLTIKAGEAFSLQSHKMRDEFWRVISGDGFITLGEERVPIVVGSDYSAPRGTKHRVEAGMTDVLMLEIGRGNFDEQDIIHFEDRYGRTDPQ